MNFNDVTIVFVKGKDYRIHFWYMSKDDAISIINLNKFKLILIQTKKLDCYDFFSKYKRWVIKLEKAIK